MSLSLPLENMSIDEKIQAMELLWEDLCQNADSLRSPVWHKKILEERERSIQAGENSYLDWEAAKKDISHSVK